MNCPEACAKAGFAFADVEPCDFDDFHSIKRACFSPYIERYIGPWDDAAQRERHYPLFLESFDETCFQKVLLNGETVGFFCYDVGSERVDGIAIQLLEKARGHGVGSAFLRDVTDACRRTGKPAFLKVFLDNPAKRLYERNGFSVYDQTQTHFFMRYDPR